MEAEETPLEAEVSMETPVEGEASERVADTPVPSRTDVEGTAGEKIEPELVPVPGRLEFELITGVEKTQLELASVT